MPQLAITILRLLALLLFSATVAAMPVKTPHVEAELVALNQSFQPGTTVQLALRLKIIDHWHTYWQNPGDSGLPTRLTWSLPGGFSAGAIEWPHPKKLPLGPLMNFGYEGEVLHLVGVQTPKTFAIGEPATLRAKADWLVCSDVCIPESADLSISLKASASTPLPDPRWTAAFSKARDTLPSKLPDWAVSAKIVGGKLAIELAPPTGSSVSITEATFFPLREDLIANAGTQVWSKKSSGFRLLVPMADPVNATIKSVDGVLVASSGWGSAYAGRAIAISAPLATSSGASPAAVSVGNGSIAPASDSLGLFAALLFALAGGLLLNLMPCVFPVLGIKIMGFAQYAKSEPALLKKQGIAFLFGVLVSFWILAGILIGLRSAGESIGWGFQLQSPLFVTLLAMLFMLMALNLSGVFEMGLRVQSAAGNLVTPGKRSTLVDAFFSGVLATVVATPCTAPMMGAALGFTLSQPALLSILVFTAIGLGMALPVFTLSLFPQWLRFLPKPGDWMVTLKQFLAFPLFATVAWLAWVLGSQRGNDGIAQLLFGLVVLALAAWLYGHWQISKPLRAICVGMLVAICGLAIAWPESTRSGASDNAMENGWVPFSTQKIAALRAQNKAIFVDFTATWCITCQVNKRVALNQESVVKRFKELDIVRMKADWTVKDPEITQALAEFGRNGVPLYVFYPPGGEPRILPEVLTPDIVLHGIGAAEVTAAK